MAIVLATIVVVVLVVGILFWRSRRASKIIYKPAGEPELTITAAERLEQFRKDLFEAYASIEAKKHYPKYIPLEQVKVELSSKYSQEQFDMFLAQPGANIPVIFGLTEMLRITSFYKSDTVIETVYYPWNFRRRFLL